MNWFSFLSSQAKKSSRPVLRSNVRPQLETLEGRIVPSGGLKLGQLIGHAALHGHHHQPPHNHHGHNGHGGGQGNGGGGQVSTGTISGTVVNDQTGSPMVGSTVVLQDSAGNVVATTTTTGPNGSFSFAGIQPGTYNVVLVPDNGFDLATATAGSLGGTPSAGQVGSILVAAGANGNGYVLREVPLGIPA